MFNIKNNILVKILLIFTIFLLFFNFCYCFASNEISFNYNNETYTFNEPFDISDLGYNYSSYFAYYNGTKYFLRAYLSNSSFVVSMKNGSPSISTQDSSDFAEVIFKYGSNSFSGLISSVDTVSYSFGPVTSSNYAPGSIKTVEDFVSSFIYTSCGIYDSEGNELVSKPSNKPYFITTQEELQSGNIEKLVISGGGYSDLDDVIYLQSMYYPENVTEEESFDSLFPRKEISLNGPSSPYYVGLNEQSEYIYEIPRSDLGIDLVEGNKYAFHLGIRDENNLFERLARLDFTVGVVNPDDVTNDKLDQQTDAIKENTETQKGIWDTIKEVLSYINPFSENFFVYKLLELLFDGIKALIIPSDGFFEEYFNSLNNWFSDRFGFLYYPIELLIDILGRYSSLSSSNLSFTIPDIPEPFNDEVLIESTTFNFNSILSNSTYKQVHDYYLLFVDFIIAFGLIKLAIKKWEEVTSN